MTTSPSYLQIICLPFEVSTSFLKGTGHAPEAIIGELDAIDSFDFHIGRNPFSNVQRKIARPHSRDLKDPHQQQSVAHWAVKNVLDNKGFPISLGGEHTVCLGPIRAARARGPLGIVQFDAHADLRDEFEGNPFSHACSMRRAVELDCPVMGVGTRAMSREEADFAKKRGINLVEGRRAAFSKDWYGLLDELPERVYLTLDMDVFDPSEVPAVGNPEPGGPGFDAVKDFLFHLFEVKDVVAADIVELRPSEGNEASVRLAARLVGILTGLRFKG